jgi:hypothetical protein
MSADEKVIIELLHSKHKKVLLSKKEAAAEVNRSCSSLDRDRKSAIGMQYIKSGDGNIYYPISEIASYIVRSMTKTL